MILRKEHMNDAKQEIRYIVLSDLHLGESHSLFTRHQGKDNHELVTHLGKCLADLIGRFGGETLPTLVLNGDLLGLSFSSYADCLTACANLFRGLTVDHKICESVAYLPGNHDQQIWHKTTADRYQKLLEQKKAGDPFPDLSHISSPLFEEGFRSDFFRSVMPEDMKVDFRVLYPNFIIPPPEKGTAPILIHHGHFAEPTYRAVSLAMQALYPGLDQPVDLEDLSAENNAMINFVYSQLGRSGPAGDRFERLMDTLSSEQLMDKHLDELAGNLAEAVNFPYLPFAFLEKMLSRKLIREISETIRTERYNTSEVCSKKTMHGVMDYLEKYGLPQLEAHDCRREELIFIWGHTHKPFVKELATSAIPRLRVLNSGGWVVPREAVPTFGASILLINQRNEVEALRIFNDGVDGGTMHFDLADIETGDESSFARAIRQYLRPEDGNLVDHWATFRNALQNAITNSRSNAA